MVKDSFCSLLSSLTESNELSLSVDFTNIENVNEQILTKIHSATVIYVNNSYVRKNYKTGLNIFNQDSEDVTDKIHKPN